MSRGNGGHRWGSLAMLLHWLVAVLLAIQLALGALIFSLDMYLEADVETYLRWIPTHKSVGLTILLLMTIRLVWRWRQARPPWPGTMPAWQRRAAAMNHRLLYLLLLVQPLLGLTQSSAYGATTTFWGLFTVPSIVPEAISRPNTDVVRLAAQDAHSIVAVVIVASVLLHLAAVIKHHFIDRDRLLASMLPKFRAN